MKTIKESKYDNEDLSEGCHYCGWGCEYVQSHMLYCGGGCEYIRYMYTCKFDEDGELVFTKKIRTKKNQNTK